MSLRIERIAQGAAVTLRLIGRIQVEHLGELERQVAASGATTILDLEEVSLVDVDVVRFLASCRAKGIALVNCSPYINEWIGKETDACS
jgi:hypothetical protein